MFILDNSVGNIMTSMFGSRMCAPKWNVSLKPNEGLLQERNFIQEHLTYGAMIGVPCVGFGIYKGVIGLFSGEEGIKEKISACFAIIVGAGLTILGHVNKPNEKQEIEDLVKDNRPSGEVKETIQDLILDESTTNVMYEGIEAIPERGVIFNFYGLTNLGKSSLLRVIPQEVKCTLERKLSHEVKVNAITISDKFLEQNSSEGFKQFLKYYQVKLQEANQGCQKGDVKEVYVLQLEEASGMFNERIKAHLEDFRDHCPGLCVAFTSNTEEVPREFTDKRGVYNVPFGEYSDSQKLDIFKSKLKISLGQDYSEELFNTNIKPIASRLLRSSFTTNRINVGTGTRDLTAFLYKIDPDDIRLIANELGNHRSQYLLGNGKFDPDQFKSILIKGFMDRIIKHKNKTIKHGNIAGDEIVGFLQSCFNPN